MERRGGEDPFKVSGRDRLRLAKEMWMEGKRTGNLELQNKAPGIIISRCGDRRAGVIIENLSMTAELCDRADSPVAVEKNAEEDKAPSPISITRFRKNNP